MIATALLLLGSCGSASRTIEVEPRITEILVRVIFGGMKDVVSRMDRRIRERASKGLGVLELPTLRIDGQQRTGVFAWLAAVNRVAGYAVRERKQKPDAGSVEYSYGLRVRGFDIRRATRISDDHVLLLTDVYGRIGPRKELYHVSLAIEANETGDSGTTITGTATGDSTIGSRWWLLRWIAERRARRGKRQPLQEFIGSEIAKGLDADLLTVLEHGGRRLYQQGDLHRIVEAFVERLFK